MVYEGKKKTNTDDKTKTNSVTENYMSSRKKSGHANLSTFPLITVEQYDDQELVVAHSE